MCFVSSAHMALALCKQEYTCNWDSNPWGGCGDRGPQDQEGGRKTEGREDVRPLRRIPLLTFNVTNSERNGKAQEKLM